MDAELLERLYREHSQAVILYCTALSGDEELAQDLTADAFVKAYLTLPENVPSFRYWLLRVCRNLWIDHLRKHRREVRNLPVERLATGVTPESRLLRNERSRCLWNAIASLPPAGPGAGDAALFFRRSPGGSRRAAGHQLLRRPPAHGAAAAHTQTTNGGTGL